MSPDLSVPQVPDLLEASPKDEPKSPVSDPSTEALPPIPSAYQMRTLQHLSRTLAEEEARFRQSAAWVERLQASCRTVATEAMGLFALLEEERTTAVRLAEEISKVSASTLSSWPSSDLPESEPVSLDDLDTSTSSFATDPDAMEMASSSSTEAFHEMWDATPDTLPVSRREARRLRRASLAKEGVQS